MTQITFGYDAIETIVDRDNESLKGTNPIHNIATGEIIGKVSFIYKSQRLWDENGNNRFFNILNINILLNELQNKNNIQLNSLDTTIYFKSEVPLSRVPFGTQFESKITSTTLPLSPDAKLKLSITQTGYRIYELNF